MNIRECDIPNIEKIGIYCITNLINGKKYIGKTGNEKGFKRRWNEHLNNFLNKKYISFYIYRAFKKYSLYNFEFSIIEIVQPISNVKTLNLVLNTIEQYWIKYYDTTNPDKGYNMTKGGEGILGYKFNEKSKQKISNSRKLFFKNNPEEKYESVKSLINWHLTNENPAKRIEVREKISKRLTKHIVTEEQKFKQSKTMKEKFANDKIIPYWLGKHLTDEHRHNISLNHWDSSGKNNPASKAIIQLTLDGQLVREYDYIREVKEYGFTYSNVITAVNHKSISKLGDNVYGKLNEEKFRWLSKGEYYEKIS